MLEKFNSVVGILMVILAMYYFFNDVMDRATFFAVMALSNLIIQGQV